MLFLKGIVACILPVKDDVLWHWDSREYVWKSKNKKYLKQIREQIKNG